MAGQWRTPIAVVAITPLIAGALAGCSSSGSSGSDTSQSAVCSDLTTLKASISDLANIHVGAGAASQLATQVSTIRQQVTMLSADAKGQYGSQVQGMQSALNNLATGVDTAKQNPSASAIAAVAGQAAAAVSAGRTLVTAVTNTC